MGKIKPSVIGQAAVFILAAVVLLVTYLNSNQASMSMPIKLDFVGEYSADDGATWRELDKNTKLSAADGDLILRGNFGFETREGTPFKFYLNHINMNIYVNGEWSFIDSRSEMGLTPSGCCRQWAEWIAPELTDKDVVEIRLDNPHKSGNGNAYNQWLNSIYVGDSYIFDSYMLKGGKAARITGLVIVVVAFMLLGVVLASCLLQINLGEGAGRLGFFTAFMGGYFIMDTADVSLWSYSNIINTYGLQLCIMLAAFCLVMCVGTCIKTRAKRAADIAAVLSLLTNMVLLVLCLAGVMVIYDTAVYFAAAHAVIFVVLLGCLFYECACGSGDDIVLVSYILLIGAALLDMADARLNLWQVGICSKTVFLGLFLLHIVRIIKVVPENYRAAVQSEKFVAEVQNSRISLMLSQIKPHFLYNCIGAISELCRQNPDRAREALGDFSDYLRLNMESINCKELIHFSRELKHIEKYLKLEKMRFGDDLDIVYDIQAQDFFIPPLVVQPLVENAVKHGICMAENGGTVTIHTQSDGDKIIITIADNGVGFDVNLLLDNDEKHIGIQNVRKRLEFMVGGTLEITSVKGEGTTAVIKFLG